MSAKFPRGGGAGPFLARSLIVGRGERIEYMLLLLALLLRSPSYKDCNLSLFRPLSSVPVG